MPDIPMIFHIALPDDVRLFHENGEYRCASLESEGFIHCCDRTQLQGVANRYYADQDELQLLLVNPDKLTGALIRENTMGGSELFPHVYSAINSEAIISIESFGFNSPERMGLSE